MLSPSLSAHGGEHDEAITLLTPASGPRGAIGRYFGIGDDALANHDYDELAERATRLLNETGVTVRLDDAAAGCADRGHTYDLHVAAILEELS